MAANMNVIALISIHTKEGLIQPGAEVILPSSEAEVMIDDGIAIPAAKQPAPTTTRVAVMTAAEVTGLETAAPPASDPKPAPGKKEGSGAPGA